MENTRNINLPSVVFGTSSLGNLYRAISPTLKKDIVNQCIINTPGNTVFDCAGKYGAGLALTSLANSLNELKIEPNRVLISNKLGWYQIPLKSPEPTFEPGVWVDLNHDAVQKISYHGILECYHQGNELLGNYHAGMVSVHDPDEYLAGAANGYDRKKRYKDILDAYRALIELKENGRVQSVGIGSKDWRIIAELGKDVRLDWVMIANSLTVHDHPSDLVKFVLELNKKGVVVINSAVFNGGFLTGGDFYNYKKVNKHTAKGDNLYLWRQKFYRCCEKYGIEPAQACIDFGFNIPGIKSIALNTTRPEKVKINIEMADQRVPVEFWKAMLENQLINLPYELFQYAKSDL